MLVNYSLDTVEDEMVPRALELRKRIARRRLKKAIDKGILTSNDLTQLKKKSQLEIKEQKRSNTDVIRAEEGLRTTQERASQQLDIQSSLHLLNRDLQRTSRLSRTRLDALSDIEQRITAMRHNLKDNAPIPSVAEKISMDLRVKNSQVLDSMFSVCCLCQRKILNKILDDHVVACKKMKGHVGGYESRPPVYDVNQDLLTSITTFVPQEPRNFKYASKGCTYIDLIWDPPVFDGGLPIFDYEIDYKKQIDVFDKGTKLWIRRIEPMAPVTTTQWCMKPPICHRGFRLKNLTAGSIYVDFRLRCTNIRGYGEYCTLMGENSIRTQDVDAPTPPLFFQEEGMTSSCMHLSWSPPIFDGGVPISEYRISYTVLERLFLATSRTNVVKRPNTVRSKTPCTSFVIRNLPHNSKIVAISIKAVNELNQVSEMTSLKEHRMTTEGSAYKKCLFEIQRVESLKTDLVDTDFYNDVTQRMKRVDLLAQLKADFSKIAEDPHEVEEKRIWDEFMAEKAAKKAAKKKAEEEEAEALRLLQEEEDNETGDVDPSSFTFPNYVRKKHFKRKIKSTEQQMKEVDDERKAIDGNRINLTLMLKEKQKFLMNVSLERDRLKDFHAPIISSSVLHGTPMNYYTASFRKELEKAYEDCQYAMTKAKRSIVEGEKSKIVLRKRYEELHQLLQDRRAAFHLFTVSNDNAMRALHGLKGLTGGAEGQITKYFFGRLKEYLQERKRAKAHVTLIFNNLTKKYLSAAFTKWSTGEHAKNSSDTHAFFSAGSLMLQQAKELREDVQRQLREAIAETYTIKQKLETAMVPKYQRTTLKNSLYLADMAEGTTPAALEMNGMHYLFEADGMAMENKFFQAAQLYETQIMYLRSMSKVNIKFLAIAYGRVGKLFLRSERFDRAIVEFDRQLSLAKEIDDVAETADAYYGMGSGYLGRAEFHEAVRYLDIAHAKYGILGHQPKQCGVKIALKECYQRLNRPDLTATLIEQIDGLENELKIKLKTINNKLGDMENRLIQSSAETEFIVTLERANNKIIYLRNLLKEEEAAYDKKEEEVNAQHELVLEMDAFLGSVSAELVQAIHTDEKEMMSHFVHDQAQVVEIEELKVRLDALKKKKVEEYGELNKEEMRLRTQLKNIQDTITALNEEFDVETGVLMTKCKHDRPFRCVAFNPANAAGDEVTGTATGGVENFVGSDGSSIHVLDYHSGGLLHIFQGDERNRLGDKIGHVGVVTCLAYDNNYVYSGSVDELIMVWDVKSYKRVRIMEGHEGTVVSLAVDGPLICSGGADTTIRLWRKETGELLRILQGHIESVLSMELGPNWLVTGSQDEEVRVWSIFWKTQHTLVGITRQRLIGHECPVTCVRYGNMEIISGDRKGRIFIWLMSTGAILRKCQVHNGQVRTMQFDATRIVSGGGDGNVCITDIGTGNVIQTLRGHVGLVLQLCFDTQRIISVARDNKLYYWGWGKKADGPPDKFHVLDKGQKLVDISKMYKIDVPTLMKWNGILEMRMCVPGMRLLVGKGDPTKLTTAEELSRERDRRREVGLAYSKKNMKMVKRDRGTTLGIEYDRVYRKAMDFDQFSLGNRLFAKEKTIVELFPDSVNVSVDPNSLGARLERNGRDKLSLNARTRGQANQVFITEDNEDEWGSVADSLALTMLEMLLEYEVYEVVLEEQRVSRDPNSVIGRMYNVATIATKEKLNEQQTARAKRLADKKKKKEAERERKKKRKRKKKKGIPGDDTENDEVISDAAEDSQMDTSEDERYADAVLFAKKDVNVSATAEEELISQTKNVRFSIPDEEENQNVKLPPIK